MHEVLVNPLGGLLPRKSVVGLTDRPDMTLDVYRGRKQQYILQNCFAQELEIWYVALPGGPLPSLFNEGPRVQHGPAPGGPRFEP